MTQYLLFLGDYLTFNGDRLKIGVGVPPKPPLTIAKTVYLEGIASA